ncbi:hypothetical protein HQ520_07020 [bacterium]|nr:hypothetical protein [bacterium]
MSQIRTEIRTADAEISAGNPDAAITSLERALLICGGEPLSESRQSRYLPLVERTLSELRQVTDEAEGGRVIMALADGEFAEFQASGVVPARFQRQEDRFTRVLAANMQSQTAAESQRREALKEEEKRKRAEAERLAAEERKRQEEAERAQAEETEDIEFVEVGDLLRYPSLYSDHRFMAGLVEKPRFVLTWAEVSSLSYLTETEDTQSLYVAHLRDPISGETVTSTRSQVVLIDPPLRGPKTVYLGGVLMPVPDRTAEFFFLALVVPIDDSETSPSPGETKPNVTVPRNIDFGSIFKDVRSKP